MSVTDFLNRVIYNNYSLAEISTIRSYFISLHSGSATARGVMDVLTSRNQILEITNDTGAYAQVGQYKIWFNATYGTQLAWLSSSGVSVQGTPELVLMHEMVHAISGLDDGLDTANGDHAGDTVRFTNAVHAELGIGDRASYYGVGSLADIPVGTSYTFGRRVDVALVVSDFGEDTSGSAVTTSDLMVGVRRFLQTFWTGGGDDFVYGGSGVDVIYGGSGADYLDGGSGWDSLDGGAGDDTIIVGSTNDFVAESRQGGNDTVVIRKAISFDADNIETVILEKRLGGAVTITADDARDIRLSKGSDDVTLFIDRIRAGADVVSIATGKGADTIRIDGSVNWSNWVFGAGTTKFFDFSDLSSGDSVDLSSFNLRGLVQGVQTTSATSGFFLMQPGAELHFSYAHPVYSYLYNNTSDWWIAKVSQTDSTPFGPCMIGALSAGMFALRTAPGLLADGAADVADYAAALSPLAATPSTPGNAQDIPDIVVALPSERDASELFGWI